MSKNKLALLGGDRAVKNDFPIYNAMGEAEIDRFVGNGKNDVSVVFIKKK